MVVGVPPLGYTGPMLQLRVFALCLACMLPLLAQAQWQWIDKDGRKVFSDRAPPSDIPDKNILKQPGSRVAAPDGKRRLKIPLPGAPA